MELVRTYTQTEFPRDPNRGPQFRLLFLLEGELSIYVGAKERLLYPHDFTFIRPFELHGGSRPGHSCKALIIDILPELWGEICPGADAMRFSINILRHDDRPGTYRSICRSLAQIVYYSRSRELSTSARILRNVSDILAILIEEFAAGTDSGRMTDQTMSRIQDILQYIITNYTRHFSLEEIADAIGFHPQYFSSYFKKQFGVSFTDYLNHYRISRSIPLLRDTRDSILNIALASGFNSHKAYSNAFEKYLSLTPREYRKKLLTDQPVREEDYSGGEFDYLRRFWNRTDPEDLKYESNRRTCVIRLTGNEKAAVNYCHNVISVGRAVSCLRSDLQKQLVRARKDLDLEYVRIRDVFSDDLFVYFEDSGKRPVFSWRALDEIFDFLISADLKPFIEIGYMPGQLASRKQYAGWQYRPNVSSPRSMTVWEQLVSSFISHLISRYGKDVIEHWLFDFWTSPNLQIANGYWNESMDRFHEFYRSTYRAVKQLDRKIRLGSPNFSCPSGLHCYREFLDYAESRGIAPDFISTHLYSCGDGVTSDPVPSFIEFSVFDNNYRIPRIKPVRETIPDTLDQIREIIDSSAFAGLPIIVDDWNVTFFPTDFTRDTCFMGPFISESYFRSCSKAYGLGFASLSDIHEDFFNTDQLFNGGPGLLTYSGIPKTSYYAISMAYRFTRRILQTGDNYIIGKTDDGYEILLYNMLFYREDYEGNDPSVLSFTNRYNVFTDASDLDFHIELPARSGSYQITRTLIDREHGSSYDAWVRMGSPRDITPDIARYLHRVSTPEMHFEVLQTNGPIILDEMIEPHSMLHIRISPDVLPGP